MPWPEVRAHWCLLSRNLAKGNTYKQEVKAAVWRLAGRKKGHILKEYVSLDFNWIKKKNGLV